MNFKYSLKHPRREKKNILIQRSYNKTFPIITKKVLEYQVNLDASVIALY